MDTKYVIKVIIQENKIKNQRKRLMAYERIMKKLSVNKGGN